ncbi:MULTISPECIES: multicopper oxidase family protein [Prauserella]|uniref:Copper oxidase n=2 Tax=Prauserella TaxID=142577 RepID=A0A318LG14_9PSEU|nr:MULTISPECIES: multicopper oxidase family protein [Prauserella]PXY16786.1 copper oxidase [Prauserella coralliicola]PXY17479.1 copper oxidase [Prauserella flavalba]TKG59678.1 multicopper oxidase family protein [Prauserella endophytica]
MTAQHRRISRRDFLIMGAGVTTAAGLAACTPGNAGTAGPTRIGPKSPAVAAAERKRRAASSASTSVSLEASVNDVDLGGVAVRTWTYGGDLPGKEIRIKRGDMLSAELSNKLPQPTSIHWHGLALRNDMDGVPVLTQPEIKAGTTFRYDFAAPDAGTYWFHPHVGTQLDRGLYAPLIVEDPTDGSDYDTELVIVLDDWLDGVDGRDPDAVLAELKKNGMVMAEPSGSSMPGMDHGSMPGMGGMPQSELLGGDAGDVTYRYVLANGRISTAPATFRSRPGQRIRLRLVNAAADTAFRVGVPGVPMTVTHTDGFPVVPQQADVALLGMGERLDAIITVPDSPVPVLALAEGRDLYAQVLIQSGRSGDPATGAAAAPQLARLPVLTAKDLKATEEVTFPEKSPDVTHTLVLEGPGAKYSWTINGKAYNPNDGLPIRSGQRVRLRFENKSEMFHPMHLHGHTFQVLGKNGRGARKDTAIVLPGTALDVDFNADNPGQWLTHCHNLYHGEAGMMTVVSYVEE